MCNGRNIIHTLHDHHRHCVWDNAIPPALRVRPNESIRLDMMEASDGQITPDASVEAVRNLDASRANPITGPIYIEGAEPGDALKVKIHELIPSGWGWTANIPGFGLLSDDFPDAALHLWDYDRDSLSPAAFGKNAQIPLKPFIGTIGLAPAEDGDHETIPPRRVGGNMDLREITAGAELILPVECEGAMFSAGDTHAAQGDGEVCGTAIESPLSAILEFEVIKGAAPISPQVKTSGPATDHLDKKGYDITTGIGEDLHGCAKSAVAQMIDLQTKRHGLSAVDAYMLCSVCADLRISEIVNAPNFVVSCYFPRIVFD